MPLLRIEAERLPFAGGDLWRLPFDRYLELTGTAFADHRAAYEETAPVFYQVRVDLDLPILRPRREAPRGVIEIKAPSHDWGFLGQFGLGFLGGLHDVLVDRGWAALLPQPRLSVTFLISLTDALFEVGDAPSEIIHIQGDIDQEYLFLAEAAGTPLPSEVIERASSLVPRLDEIRGQDPLAAALASLLASTAPTLFPPEQLALAVIALEALLLPEVTSGLGDTFSRRSAALLAMDTPQFNSLQATARHLYDARSAVLHATSPRSPEEGEKAAREAYAQQLLAAAILALLGKVRPETSLEQVRERLDEAGGSFDGPDPGLPRAASPGLGPWDRLGRAKPSMVAVVASQTGMQAPEGKTLSWSPLIGLGAESPIAFGQQDAPLLMPLTGPEVLSMEDRDVRRDFVALLQMPGDQPVASVLAVAAQSPEPDNQDATIQKLLRTRDLAVVALRLSGLTTFHDPELLGSYVYEGYIRYRRPTVLRQTLLEMLRREPEGRARPEDGAQIAQAWRLLATYDATARHPTIDQVLVIFRRVFDARFLPVGTRAGLMFSALEAMLAQGGGSTRAPGGKTRGHEFPGRAVVREARQADPQRRCARVLASGAGRKHNVASAHGSAPGGCSGPPGSLAHSH
jgi:hypothetical protein